MPWVASTAHDEHYPVIGRLTADVDAEASAAAAMCSGMVRSAESGIMPELIFSATSASWRARSSRCFWMAASSCWLPFSLSLASCVAAPDTSQPTSGLPAGL